MDGIAIDHSGNLWTSDEDGQNSLSEFNSSGTVVAGSPFAAGILNPGPVAIDASGDPRPIPPTLHSMESATPASCCNRFAGAQTAPPDRAVVPPQTAAFSNTVVASPFRAAITAPVRPAPPDPITATSTLSSQSGSAVCWLNDERIGVVFEQGFGPWRLPRPWPFGAPVSIYLL